MILKRFMKGVEIVSVFLLPSAIAFAVATLLGAPYNSVLVIVPILLYMIYVIGDIAVYCKFLIDRRNSTNDKIMIEISNLYEEENSPLIDRIMLMLLYFKMNSYKEINIQELMDQLDKFKHDGKDKKEVSL